jgi:uncharacterized membrane protein YfcA
MMPFVIILLPAFSAFFTDTLETILLLSVIPISLYAFLPTWSKHRNVFLAVLFTVGLAMVLFAQFGIKHFHYISIEQFFSALTSDPLVLTRIGLLITGVILLSISVYKNNRHTHVCHNPHHHH